MNLEDIFNFIGPSEAEAFPIMKGFKALSKEATLPSSSTAVGLQGKELFGKTIEKVTKSIGDKRNFIFTDGTVKTATKDYVNSLMRHQGDQTYLERLAGLKPGEQIQQVTKSIGMREAAGEQMPLTSMGRVERIEKKHAGRLREMQLDPTPKVLAIKVGDNKGKTVITLPKAYAEIAERLGLIKVVKEIK